MKRTGPPAPPKPPHTKPAPLAPPVYRPAAPAGQSKPANPVTAGNRPQGTWPPVYRPNPPALKTSVNTSAPQPLVRTQPGRAPMMPVQTKPAMPPAPPVYRPIQAKPVPLSKPANRISGPVPPAWNRPGTIQRSAKSKQELESELEDAMDIQDWDKFDEVSQQMSELPGDSAQSFGSGDGDNYDLTYKSKQIRFSFKKGLRAILMASQTSGGKLHCALGAGCYVSKSTGTDEIKVNSSGKEVWTSASGKVHETAPPIDHHGPDWKDRLKTLMSKNYDVQTFQSKGQQSYNDPPLRIIHMVCNSKRNGG